MEQESKATVGFRASIDFAMGVLYLIVAGYVFLFPELLLQFGNISVYVFSGLAAAYGLFRIIRGVYRFRDMQKRNNRNLR